MTTQIPSALEANLDFVLSDLSAPARIRVDRWGIPHIEATSENDLWFMQGFNAARDRLFQIDLWRKRGLGLLAADFGPGYLEQDKAARMFLYRGDMAAEWAAYGPGAKAICARFAQGINAYVALCDNEPQLMPPEFAMLGNKPAFWQAEDVVRIRSHGLTRNALWEVQRLHMLAHADSKADLLRKFLYPSVDVKVPDGITPEDCPLEALAIFRLAQANVTFSPERLACGLADALKWRKVNELNEVLFDIEFSGSNNWVIAGQRTESGLPILASDPHRAHSLPGLRYIQHLKAPGIDMIGAGEPCVPGISIGHNGFAAFGLTIFGADQEDVYVLKTNSDDPARYLFSGEWREMSRIDEIIPVKGHADQHVSVEFSHHGPILWRNGAKTRAVAIRSCWFEPGAAPYLQSLTMLRAKAPAEFRASAEKWGSPSVNLVYADAANEIAWSPGGFMPYRLSWNGLTPVPGDGSHEWQGMISARELPFVQNPEKGFVATANELNLPDDWPHDRLPIGFEWTEGSRARRIHDVLAAENQPHQTAASAALQTDAFSYPAKRLCALLAGLKSTDLSAAKALALLTKWDHTLGAKSSAAALFELWFTKHLKPALFTALVPASAMPVLPPGDVEGICRALEEPDIRWGDAPGVARDAMLLSTLATAWRDAEARLGLNSNQWQWGKLHQGFFEHPLSGMKESDCAALDIGPFPKGGSASSPMHSGYRASDFRVTHGASVRLIIDLAKLDQSLCINAPGQSGDPRSSHYADLAPLWAEGRYVPLLFSEAAVADATQFTWTLRPSIGAA